MTDSLPAPQPDSPGDVRRKALFDGFQFALKVCGHVHHPPTTFAEQEVLWDLVTRIADSEETIIGTPAEWVSEIPNLPRRVVDMMWGTVNQLVAKDRDIAQAVLDGRETQAKRVREW